MTQKPVWLLDVDGVLNARKPRWGAPFQGTAHADGISFPIRWAPKLATRIRTLAASGRVEIRWCTTWCAYVDQIEDLLRLPAFDRCWTDDLDGDDAPEAKLAAARQVLADGRRLIWTDDSEVPEDGPLHEELSAGGRSLLIRPAFRHGLERAHMRRIEEFCAATTT